MTMTITSYLIILVYSTINNYCRTGGPTKASPPIPMISASAENLYKGIHFHPSYAFMDQLLTEMFSLAKIPCHLHEVDGAYSDERFHAFCLTQDKYNPGKGGVFVDAVRCQNHATHLITVSMMSLIQGNLLSKLYQLSVFLANLGYVLRLQLALKEWILEHLEVHEFSDTQALQPDPLMTEIVDYLVASHHQQQQEGSKRATAFDRHIRAFRDMWNGRASGPPEHYCNYCSEESENRHCQSRGDCASKMSKALIDLLLTSSPTPQTSGRNSGNHLTLLRLESSSMHFSLGSLTLLSMLCSFKVKRPRVSRQIAGWLKVFSFIKCRENATWEASNF